MSEPTRHDDDASGSEEDAARPKDDTGGPKDDAGGPKDDAGGPDRDRWECARCGAVIDDQPRRCPNCHHRRFVRAYRY